jgi:hypothetical protein
MLLLIKRAMFSILVSFEAITNYIQCFVYLTFIQKFSAQFDLKTEEVSI